MRAVRCSRLSGSRSPPNSVTPASSRIAAQVASQPCPYHGRMPSVADFVIRNALIADGSGGPLANGDVAIGDGTILTTGAEPAPSGRPTVTLDARGELVCIPGFIDVHTHDDAALLRHPD